MAWFWTKFEKNCWRTAPGLSAYSSQQQQKAERQQKSSRVQFCSNLVPNHFTGLSLAPRSLCIRWFWNIFSNQKLSVTITYYEIIKLFRVWWFCKNGTKSAHFMLIFSQNSVNKSCLLGSAHSKVCLMKYCNEREVYNCIILQKYRIKGLHPQIFV